ncbi:hypothetical protein ACLB2K_045263 [Fragaria x ananassa]
MGRGHLSLTKGGLLLRLFSHSDPLSEVRHGSVTHPTIRATESEAKLPGSARKNSKLPQRKKDAIQSLGFGLLNKVAILFPYNFWGGDLDTFGHLTEDPSMRGEFFLFYSYSSISGGPLLVALVAGDAAIKFEQMSPLESVNRVLEILRGIFHPKGSSGDDYDILAESIGDGRVFFAGEATNKQYPATMHGALLSGMREAANILRVAKKRTINPSQKFNNSSKEDEDLDNLFDTPDLTFGSFSVLFDPRSSDPESTSLFRVKLGGEKLDMGSFSLYSLMSKKHAFKLRDVDGDGNKMTMLNFEFGVRLVGRKGLSGVAESLITCIRLAK